WVEEIPFDDGSSGYATDGTPVDCVRFAELGLVGERPELIVSGINHGANLGDDITYSGTVAAALEGIVLGIPAAGLSQQSSGGGLGYVSARAALVGGWRGLFPRPLLFRRRRRLLRTAGGPVADRGDAGGDADQRQLPRWRAERDRGHEARQTHLQRRTEAGRRGVRRRAAPLRDLRLAARLRGDRGDRSLRGR